MAMLNLELFTHKTLSNAYTLLTMAKRAEISLDELLEVVGTLVLKPKQLTYSETKKRTQEHLANDRFVKVPCSVCGQHTRLLPVNNSPATMIGGGYNTVVVCHDSKCMHTEYTEETISSILKKHRKK